MRLTPLWQPGALQTLPKPCLRAVSLVVMGLAGMAGAACSTAWARRRTTRRLTPAAGACLTASKVRRPSWRAAARFEEPSRSCCDNISLAELS